MNFLDHKINIILRNYNNFLSQEKLTNVVRFFHNRKQKIFLSNDVKTAIKAKFDGVYIPSFNRLSNLKNFNLRANFEIIGSAHNQCEILQKIDQGCKKIFISPLFKTYKKKYLGIVKFNKINLLNSKKIIALGGINQRNLSKLKLTKAEGFASISWIKKNRPKKLGRFQ